MLGIILGLCYLYTEYQYFILLSLKLIEYENNTKTKHLLGRSLNMYQHVYTFDGY